MHRINRLLIANRGEIAVRIARTAHRLGISTVGVYSDADANALHVDSVDMAVALGGQTSAESYLRGDAVIAAALATGCDAVHPGYGFLAENAAFARAVGDAGLIWVGATPEQIELLGDKIAAKRAAVAAGVPTTIAVPILAIDLPSDLVYPVIVKAAAGGGGRGMRIVRTAEELAPAVEAAAREAQAAFGDPSLFVEPYIARGRHIEVQIIGDAHGNVVHLGERECSIQRRNQKVVEESPSAGISSAIRTALCDGALALARSVGYLGAGTVEFMVGDDDSITFLEVNTRLQVEHPVTEAVTGLDLVELQLRVAAGEPLPISQADVRIAGHAIEVRVVAEDPAADWLPSTGELHAFRFGDGVRIDSGFRAGAEVSSNYDSLLAKVIAYATTRSGAAQTLARALRHSSVDGVRTNLASLIAVLEEPNFLAADTPTAYLADHPDVLTANGPTGDERLALLLGAVFTAEADARASDSTTGFAPSGWRSLRTQGQRIVWLLDGEAFPVEYRITGSAATVLVGPPPSPTHDGTLSVDERRAVHVRLLRRSATEQALEVDGVRTVVKTALDGDRCRTSSAAGSLVWRRAPRFVVPDVVAAGAGPVSPLPGTVIAVHVEAGQTVAEGALLVVVEAMKMEHSIRALAPSVVDAVHVAVGGRVDTGDLLVSLSSLEDS